jgi:hypothetical protein
MTAEMIETVASRDISDRSLAIILLLSFVFTWTGMWRLTSWWENAAVKGYILHGGTLTTTDPDRYRRSSEAALAAQKRLAVVWRKTWPLAAIALLAAAVLIVSGLS